MRDLIITLYHYPIWTGFFGAAAGLGSSFWLWVEQGQALVALLGGILGVVSASLAITLMVLKLRGVDLSRRSPRGTF